MPYLVPVLLFSLACLITTPSLAIAVTPTKDAALRAAERVACGRAGCTDKCRAAGQADRRMRVLASHLGQFDARTPKSAFVTLLPCSDPTLQGRERSVVFLRQDKGRWRVVQELDLSLMRLTDCERHTVGRRDVLLCRESFFSFEMEGTALCSATWTERDGITEECVLETYHSLALDPCRYGAAESTTMGEWRIERPSADSLLLRVPVISRKLQVKSGETPDAGDENPCRDAHSELMGLEADQRVEGFSEQTYWFSFQVTGDGLEVRPEEVKAVRDLRSEAILPFEDSYRFVPEE